MTIDNTITKTDLKNVLQQVVPTADDIKNQLVDYIIEEGTSGIWTYRKWNSGIAECWGRGAVTTYSCTTQSGNLWYTSTNFAFPSGLFTSVISGQSNRAQGTGSTPSNTLVGIYGRELTTTNFGVWVTTPQSTSQSLSISLYAIGRWKE